MLSRTEGIEIAGLAESGEEALAVLESIDPDVLLLDLSMPRTSGLDVIAYLTTRGQPRPRILVLSAVDDQDMVLEAVRTGAHGYILKSASPNELVGAIRRVAGGDQFYDSVVAKAFLRGDQRQRDASLLSNREVEILRLSAEGLTTRDIAARLFLSSSTIKSHLDNIYRKLDASDRAQAVAIALRRNLLS